MSPVAACSTNSSPAVLPWKSWVAPSSSMKSTSMRKAVSPSAETRTSSGRMPTWTRLSGLSPGAMSVTGRRLPATSTRPSPSTMPSMMFIGGEPMKVATKRVAGRR